ncbi:hypothetical protein [Pedobacter heparinus]|uniref:hypothetical protein n=1 Tax=Pedobacter heparinus TaxID=984 RepID=UPI0029304EEA|nr:hypothetical protein [Pedobacter heparinus]
MKSTARNRIKAAVTLVCFLILWMRGYSQNQPTPVIPPSPTATGLGKYGDIPVSLYTGIPSVDIPLYEIKTSGLNVPISLNYHGSGVRVEEEASWVGLNWSLLAGGVITRSVRGLDDLNEQAYLPSSQERYGYPDAPALPLSFGNIPGINDYGYSEQDMLAHLAMFGDACSKRIDVEPDAFYFNFGGRSGKFVLEKRASSSDPIVVCLSAQEKISINVNYDPGIAGFKWTLITEDGTRYIFGTSEKTRSTSSSSGMESSSDPGGDPEIVTSSWYLDEIIAPNGENIHFKYSAPSVNGSRSQLSRSESRIHRISSGGEEYEPVGHTYHRSLNVTYNVYLEEIDFRNGNITFVRDDRTDVQPFVAGALPKKLKEIIISTVINTVKTPFKSFDLGYTYFNNSSSSYAEKRLKLISVTERNGSDIKPPYTFEYIDGSGMDLPAKNSKARDHWGFYNGKSNTSIYDVTSPNNNGGWISTLIPPTNTLAAFGQNFLAGADRNADTAYVKYGVLKKVTYPTGGTSEFEFESGDFQSQHQVVNHRNEYLRKFGSLIAYPGIDFPDQTFPEEITITVPDNTVVTMTANVNYSPYDPCSNNASPDLYASIERVGTPYYVKGLVLEVGCDPGSDYKVGQLVVSLSAGTYLIKTYAEGTIETGLVVSWDEQTSVVEYSKPGGGVRIKKTRDYDGIDHANDIVKQYTYGALTTGGAFASSGTLLRTPLYENIVNNSLKRSSDSNIPLGNFAQGNPIGYGMVTVSSGDNGKSDYYYRSIADEVSPEYFPGIPNAVAPGNGLLEQTIDYKKVNNSYKKIKEVTNTYNNNFSQLKTVKGMKIQGCGNVGELGYLTNTKIMFYDNLSEWIHPESQTTTIYDPDDESKFTQSSTLSFYGNPAHYQVTKTENIQSDGSKLITEYKYPADYAGVNSGFIGMMKGPAHIHNAVVEKVVKKEKDSNTKIVGASFNTYDDFGFPVGISELELNAPKVNFTSSLATGTAADSDYNLKRTIKYSQTHNPIEVKDKNEVVTSYLWGYGGQYPVAEIKNADYTAIENIKGAVVIDNFSQSYPDKASLDAFIAPLRTGLPNAQITTYIYNPLVGLTSQTDAKGMTAYYEYDTFQRLKYIKDQDGNILKSYDYHYKP